MQPKAELSSQTSCTNLLPPSACGLCMGACVRVSVSVPVSVARVCVRPSPSTFIARFLLRFAWTHSNTHTHAHVQLLPAAAWPMPTPDTGTHTHRRTLYVDRVSRTLKHTHILQINKLNKLNFCCQFSLFWLQIKKKKTKLKSCSLFNFYLVVFTFFRCQKQFCQKKRRKICTAYVCMYVCMAEYAPIHAHVPRKVWLICLTFFCFFFYLFLFLFCCLLLPLVVVVGTFNGTAQRVREMRYVLCLSK